MLKATQLKVLLWLVLGWFAPQIDTQPPTPDTANWRGEYGAWEYARPEPAPIPEPPVCNFLLGDDDDDAYCSAHRVRLI